MIRKLFFGSSKHTNSLPQPQINDCPNTFRLVQGMSQENIRPKVSTDSYTLMFVLEGEVDIMFERSVRRSAKVGTLIAFYNPALQSILCSGNVTLILHAPSEAVARRLDDCVKSFRSPSSEPLPILSPLSEWLERLYIELAPMGMICSPEKERELTDKLLGYGNPGIHLGEVYVAYHTARLLNR